MSEFSKKDREITINRVRGEATDDMFNALQYCGKDLPSITTAYNNKYIELEKEFLNANIDFYDREQCETRFIIENRLQASCLMAEKSLECYLSACTSLSKEQLQEYVDSYKKPTKFEKIFKGAKYNPKEKVLTDEQESLIKKSKESYKKYCNEIYNFTIKDNIVEAILFYKTLRLNAGATDFDERIDIIDNELQTLGYESIKGIVEEQSKLQDLSMSNISNLKSVPINKKQKSIDVER